MNHNRVSIIIPAKGNSKGITNKNQMALSNTPVPA
jgi:CMP-N-acetylneuraminic acid synthetase